MTSQFDPADLEAARAAKSKLLEQLKGNPLLRGIGITEVDHRFAVKVNLARPSPTPLPLEVDGVPVKVDIVGDLIPY